VEREVRSREPFPSNGSPPRCCERLFALLDSNARALCTSAIFSRSRDPNVFSDALSSRSRSTLIEEDLLLPAFASEGDPGDERVGERIARAEAR
jgi:hypothetical protein